MLARTCGRACNDHLFDMGARAHHMEGHAKLRSFSTSVRMKRRPHPSPGSRLAELMNNRELPNMDCTPRYPIILCHGLYGFDVRGPFWGLEYHYWSTTLDVLRKKAKAKVYVHAVPPTGSIEERAMSLHRFLCDPSNGLRGQRLNFIGHSMGGLDVRYLISTIRPDPSDYIPVSLTTVATPHRGSPVMDWCSANIGVGLELMEELLRNAGHSATIDTTNHPLSLKSPLFRRRRSTDDPEFSPRSPSSPINGITRMFDNMSNAFSSYILSTFDQPAFTMLTTKYMNKLFNPATPDDQNVLYFSVAARARNMAFWHPLWLPKLVMDKSAQSHSSAAVSDGSSWSIERYKGNDGLVSVSSARWGEFLGVMEGWDHWDVRGPGGPNRLRPVDRVASRERRERREQREQRERREREDAALKSKQQEDKHTSSPASPTEQVQTPALPRGWLAIYQTLASITASPSLAEQNFDDSSWDWLEMMRAENDDTASIESLVLPESEAVPVFPAAANARYEDDNGENEVAHKMAEWIASHLPEEKPEGTFTRVFGSPKSSPVDRRSSIPFIWPSRRTSEGDASNRSVENSVGDSGAVNLPPRNNETFARFWLALCRNLREHDL